MKKRGIVSLAAIAISCSVLFSSCIGSFSLFNKLLDWNKTIDSKFVNELVFIAFNIVPVYEIAYLADALVINSIEFWTGSNPVADAGTVKTVEGENGIYTVETKTDGYQIKKEGEEKAIDLVFDQNDKSWSVEADGESQKIFHYEGEEDVVMYLPNGEQMSVKLDKNGIFAFQQAVKDQIFYFAAN